MVVKTQSEAVNKSQSQGLCEFNANGAPGQNYSSTRQVLRWLTRPPPDGCVRCHLCIRVCKEIVGAGALKMEKKDGVNFVVPMEGLCIGCGTSCEYLSDGCDFG